MEKVYYNKIVITDGEYSVADIKTVSMYCIEWCLINFVSFQYQFIDYWD